MALPPQWLDELRDRTQLSSLIGRSIKVTRAGREWKACCPFHNEKTPSFTINDEKGFYHCFGCGAHGDAIRWMTDQRGLAFIDAIKELAAAAGMDVPAPDPRSAARAEAQKSLRDVTEAAAHWFIDQLNGADGEGARAYLKQRGISDTTRRQFGIGYAPDGRQKLKVQLRDFPTAMLVDSGMLIQPPDDAPEDRREPYDRFRGRLMIPINDPRGRCIAFGGRILGAGEPKYLNSPETPLFDKGRVLFNLDRAAPTARTTGRLIIVEGYMDVIALAQAGIAEAVAPLGTALTEQQIALAWRLAPQPLLAFDGDAAGRKAALRAAERVLPVLRPGHSLAFVLMPAGQDPDDVVRVGGAAAMSALLDAAIPLVDFLWAEATQTEAATPEVRAQIKQRLMQWADMIADKDVGALYRSEFRSRFDALYFARRPAEARAAPGVAPRQPGRGNWQTPAALPASSAAQRVAGQPVDHPIVAAIIGGLLRHPSLIPPRIDVIQRLQPSDRAAAALLDAICDAALTTSGLDTEGLMAILAPMDMYNTASAFVRADGMAFSFNREMVPDAVNREQIARDLDEALGAIAGWGELTRAMAAADAAAMDRLDDDSWNEQQRLRSQLEAMRRRMMDMVEAGGDAGVAMPGL